MRTLFCFLCLAASACGELSRTAAASPSLLADIVVDVPLHTFSHNLAPASLPFVFGMGYPLDPLHARNGEWYRDVTPPDIGQTFRPDPAALATMITAWSRSDGGGWIGMPFGNIDVASIGSFDKFAVIGSHPAGTDAVLHVYENLARSFPLADVTATIDSLTLSEAIGVGGGFTVRLYGDVPEPVTVALSLIALSAVVIHRWPGSSGYC